MIEVTKPALDLLAVSLRSFIIQLKEENEIENGTSTSDYDGGEVTRQLVALSDTISHECTKFSMIFTDQGTSPTAKTSETLCNRLIGMSVALFRIAENLPVAKVGRNFRRSIRETVVDVFESISALVVAAQVGSANTKAQLKETGTVWETCERLKNLPKDSRELLLRNISGTLDMVSDAFSEIEKLNAESNSASTEHNVDDDSDEDVTRSFNEREKVQLNACTQLVKTAKASLSKVSASIGKSNSDSNSSWTNSDDELTSILIRISPAVDDVVSSFYEGSLDSESHCNEVKQLRDVVEELLNTFRKTPYYQEETHGKWMKIICTAVQHNFTKYHFANESASK